ncbi:MAG TPA: LLM class F420-dependent oxidoreductase [Acidimicrobiales bacterium]|nr:LLM class F420-dependent oxidoreductase [Acidimicrobiales bacterium]
MRVSMSVGLAGDFGKTVERVVALDKAGLDMALVGEGYGFDAATMMGYLAAKTEHVQIGAGILSIYSRTPAMIAQTAAGLDYLSGGRAILGLGTSGPQVIEGWHGVPFDRPMQRTRDIIDICRQVWRRERLTHEGAFTVPLPPGQGTGLGKPIRLNVHPVRDRIPIYVASLGPNNVEMTAEVADGWLLFLYLPERADSVWGSALARGTAKRSADLAPLEVHAGGTVAIGDGIEHLRDLARPRVALYVGGMGARGSNFYNDLARRYGYEAEAERIQALYLDGKRQEAEAAVPAELLEKTSLIGPAGYVKDRIAAYRDTGVTVLSIDPLGEDPVKVLEQVKEWAA